MGVKVRKKKDRWWIFIDHHGRRKAKCIGPSKRAADQVAEKIRAKLALGQFSLTEEEKPPTLADYGTQWLDTYAKVHLKPATSHRYMNDFRLHLRPIPGRETD